ncbi:uncharacterized protein BCR38DRAFT_489619 [Pseudomassariella vexata]|uniref:Uncharacterized protein n=1 Tax=Pseudomassariella vexata TaxID=1141098 RepID=A0A1Y2DFT0_9PEZI|nr:uncharacterized protein BCR38DRAFT_489619 [Pseudomassariella vexata]ORY58140.1 hypothetical protein BCR38DRAFT_489619 [Pseudomassariella vexata]
MSLLLLKYVKISEWSKLTYVQWLVLAIYTGAFIFNLSAAVLQFGVDLSSTYGSCEVATLICLALYVSTKLVSLISILLPSLLLSSQTKTASLVIYGRESRKFPE